MADCALAVGTTAHGRAIAAVQLAHVTELNAMLSRLEDALITIGVILAGEDDHIMFALRALLGQRVEQAGVG